MKLDLHAYQKSAAQFMLERPAAGLFLDPGLGKTAISLVVYKALRHAGYVDKALVVAPLRAMGTSWPDELAKWDRFQDLSFTTLHGPKKADRLRESHDLYLINYDGLVWLATQPKHLLPKMLIADESTKVKNTQTQRSKALRQMLPAFKRRFILTGTPTANGLIDLFGQIFVLDEGRALGRYITHYRRTFFYQKDFMGWEWDLLPGADKRIFQRIDPIVLRMKASDHLDLPKLHTVTTTVELPPSARKVYTKLEKELILRLDRDEIAASNAAVASGKLRQIASGWVYVDEGEGRRVHEAKLEALHDLVEELSGQPVLVAYQFLHERNAIAEAFGHVPSLGGDITPSRADMLIHAWNNGKIPILLLHPASAGHGLNLQAGGRHLMWFSLPWSYELYDQTIHRIYRQGQKGSVIVHQLIAKDTIDEMVSKTLTFKERNQSKWLGYLKDYFKGRRKG